MWLVNKAASKMVRMSQNIRKQQPEAEKMIKQIINNTDSIMPMRQMSTLATKSYEIEHFDNMVEFISQKLGDVKMERKSLKKRLKLLMLVTYLIKYGAGGFIDEFRSMMDLFTTYEQLGLNEKEEDEKLKLLTTDLSERATYLKTLLKDKAVLAWQKEVVRSVREKMMAQEGDYSQQNKQGVTVGQSTGEERRETKEERVSSFLQMYVWKYTSKLDKKLDDITDSIIERIDDYLDMDMPESFEIDEIDTSAEKSRKPKVEVKESSTRLEGAFMKQKLQLEDNLLDLKIEPVSVQPKLDQSQSAPDEGENCPVIVLDLDPLSKGEEEEKTVTNEEKTVISPQQPGGADA